MAERIVGEQCPAGWAERRSNDVMSSIFCVRQTRYVDTAGLGEYYLNHSDTNHEAYEIYKTDHRRITEWRITGGYLELLAGRGHSSSETPGANAPEA